MEETTIQTPVTEDPAMDEHRAALCKMRCDFALEQLFAASGARDPAVLRRLIDVDEGDVVIGEDGIPDVHAVRDKIETLRREQAYLFRETPEGERETAVPTPPSPGMRLGVMTQTDLSQLDDAAYYRAVMARKHGRRR